MIENSSLWIVSDVDGTLMDHSHDLTPAKEITLTSLQYVIFTLIAIYGYRSWKKILDKTPPISSG